MVFLSIIHLRFLLFLRLHPFFAFRLLVVARRKAEVNVKKCHRKLKRERESGFSIDFTSLKKQISRQKLSQMAIRRVLVLIQARARTRARDKHTQTCRKPKAKRKTRNEDGAVFAASTLCEPPRFSVHRFIRFSPFFALSVFPISCFCACA